MKYLYILIFCVLLTLMPLKKAYALDFNTSYEIDYEVQSTGETQVIQTVTLKNLTNKIFASNYTLSINNMKVYDVQAGNSKGDLKTDVTTTDNQTKINVQFDDQIIGIGKELSWQIKYKTNDISSVNGSVLEVNIPRAASLANVDSYVAYLQIPESFGPEIYVSPEPNQKSTDKNLNTYKFTLSQVQASPINAAFGSFQAFNYRLKYTLTNPGFFSKNMTIALPPDIKNQQQVFYQDISPRPQNLQIDPDGNYLGVFQVSGNSSLNITLTGAVKVLAAGIPQTVNDKFSDIPQSLIDDYTERQKYWETDDPNIKNIALGLKNTNESVVANAYSAYQYVVQNLHYKDNKSNSLTVERLGAAQILTQKNNAICMEFVDLFVALSRAMGIPARALNGYAFGNNSPLKPLSINLRAGDVLHAWAEFYDPKYGWIQVDPTWGSTSGLDYFYKLDTDHVTFVIQGLSSEYPLPAGSYKSESDDNSQVDVNFASDSQQATTAAPKIELENAFSLNIFKLLAGFRKYKISNNGNVTLFNIMDSKTALPPFSSSYIYAKPQSDGVPVNFQTFDGTNQSVTVTLD